MKKVYWANLRDKKKYAANLNVYVPYHFIFGKTIALNFFPSASGFNRYSLPSSQQKGLNDEMI